MAIVYDASAETTETGFHYNVRLRYGDQENNQLVSDPVNCIDWRIYQIANAYDIDHSRVGSTSEGDVPTWPNAEYAFN